jgi:DNA polymerase III epsilon subunit-like protein
MPFYQTYCKPMYPCEPEAEKIHGITREYYRWAPSDIWACWGLLSNLRSYAEASGEEIVLSGYNVDTFDIPLVGTVLASSRGLIDGFKSIDVMRLALRRNDGQSYKLVNIFEQECKDHADYQELVSGAHGAMADCLMSGAVLKKLMVRFNLRTLEAVLDYLATPMPLTVMPHGKHAGVPFDQVPTSYLKWAAETWTHMNPDLRLSFQQRGYLRGS